MIQTENVKGISMIYVISYDNNTAKIRNTKFIQLQTDKPLRDIQYLLSNTEDDDLIVMLPKELGVHTNHLIKTIPLYDEKYSSLALSIEDPEKYFVSQSRNVLKESDVLMFKRGHVRRKLKDIQSNASYDKIRHKLVRKCGNGDLYAPEDREPGYVSPEELERRRIEEIEKKKREQEMMEQIQEVEKETSPPFVENLPVIEPQANSRRKVKRSSRQKEYHVRINLGIGDILFARSVLDAQSNRFDKVYISPDYNVYNDTRQPNKKEREFTDKLLEMVFQPPYYHLEKERIEEYPHRFCQTFSTLDGFPLVVPNISNVICEGTPLNIGPYITVSTRVREMPISEYETKVKERFLNSILELSNHYKIVILGEQKLADYKEHKILEGRVFTIYEDLIDTLPSEQVLDLSFKDVKKIKEDRMTRFKQECLYMRDAEWNIVLGNGGNSCIAASIGNAIGHFSGANPKGDYYNRMFDNGTEHTGVYYTKDTDKFIKKLANIINPDKPIYKICVNMGVGDLLIIRGELDKVKDKFKQVYITPNIPFFNDIRSKEYTKGFIREYIELLFPPPYYKITSDLSYPKRDGHGIQTFDKIAIASPHHLTDLFCVGKPLDIGPYVTINTKIRIIQKSSYINFRQQFYEKILELSEKYPLVILGDRKLPGWKEFKMFPNDIFTIYDDIVKYIPKEKYIDLTFNDLHTGTLQRIQQDCLYMKNAVNNIFLGAGGSWCLALVSGKSLSYYEPGNSNNHWREYTKIKSDAYITDNLQKYLYWITQI